MLQSCRCYKRSVIRKSIYSKSTYNTIIFVSTNNSHKVSMHQFSGRSSYNSSASSPETKYLRMSQIYQTPKASEVNFIPRVPVLLVKTRQCQNESFTLQLPKRVFYYSKYGRVTREQVFQVTSEGLRGNSLMDTAKREQGL